jgi:hypothetical protein
VNRLTAILIAVALVVGAVFVRSKINTHKTESSAVLRLTCSTELEATCTALANADKRLMVTVDPAGSTADRLAKVGDPGFDGWLTLGPWENITTATENFSGGGFASGATGYGSRMAFAIKPDRLAALQAFCATQAIDWNCLQKAAAKGQWSNIPGAKAEWGLVKIGLSDASANGIGLAALGQAAVTFFKSTDISSTDLPAFQTWLGPLVGAVTQFDDPLAVLAVRPAELDVAITAGAPATPYLTGVAASSNKPVLIYPSPVATAEIYLGTAGTANGRRLSAVIFSKTGTDALRAGGWVPAKQGGEPDPGVLAALRSLWKQVHP